LFLFHLSDFVLGYSRRCFSCPEKLFSGFANGKIISLFFFEKFSILST
jgi:hypothetical protein